MRHDDIEAVAVLGAGNMGHGITELAAMAGYDVTMRDIEEEPLQDGYESIEWSLEKLSENGKLDEDPDTVLGRITTTVDLADAVAGADVVVEAAPESMEIKRDVFEEVDRHAPDDALLATNTSSLSITEIASETDDPERVVGMHFFNPPVKMDLVEVIYGEETADETAEVAYSFAESLGKTPIYVRKDVRGFVVNTVLLPFMDEAAWMVSDDLATIREIDAAMVYQRGYPMGPFELSDVTGLDIGVNVAEEAGDPVPPVLAERVEDGHYGRKAGRGYYEYEDGDGPDYEPGQGEDVDTLRIEARMINQAAWLVGQGVAKPEEIDTGMRLGTGFPEGTCRRADKIGLDRVLTKLEELHEETGAERYRPVEHLQELVEEGKTGEESGEGFYAYDSDDMEYRDLDVALTDDGLLAVELDRPERMNALSNDLLEELDHLFSTVDPDDVRCVTIEGKGDAFSAGADIGGFGAMSPTDAMDLTPGLETVNDFPRPVIAKIHGYCLGGGFELALACDLRIATADATFGTPEISLGLIPGGGGTQRLMRTLGEARAKELVFRGNQIDADRAAEWGIVNRAVDPDEFDAVVDEFVTDVVEGPPIGHEVAKMVMNQGEDASLEAALHLESQGFGLLMSTDDATEGTAAFTEDREPEFEGK